MATLTTIQADHMYPVTPGRVWRALTDPATIPQWWGSGNIRAAVGHAFELDMGPWGKQACQVVQVEQDRLFQVRFANGTVLTWTLSRAGPGTHLSLAHEGFDLDAPASAAAYEEMRNGWPRLLQRLATVI